MLDAEDAEQLKRIASRHGMTVATYMRVLLRAVAEAEAGGFFAPAALRRYIALSRLLSVSMALAPRRLLERVAADERAAEEALQEGARLGQLLRSLNVQLEEAVEVLAAGLGVKAVFDQGRALLLPPEDVWEELARHVLLGVAQGYGAPVRNLEGGVVEIALSG
jgi:hypothetical protein